MAISFDIYKLTVFVSLSNELENLDETHIGKNGEIDGRSVAFYT
jgi:hypothetical protein